MIFIRGLKMNCEICGQEHLRKTSTVYIKKIYPSGFVELVPACVDCAIRITVKDKITAKVYATIIQGCLYTI